MSRLYDHDVKEGIKTKLDASFNAMINTIRTERSDATIPYCNNFTYTELTYNYPEGTIKFYDESELKKEILSDNIDLESEVFKVRINIILMTQINYIDYYMDYHLEALKRVLHGCNITGFTWLRYEKSKQEDLIDENLQTYKSGYCDFEVQIN